MICGLAVPAPLVDVRQKTVEWKVLLRTASTSILATLAGDALDSRSPEAGGFLSVEVELRKLVALLRKSAPWKTGFCVVYLKLKLLMWGRS